MATAAATTTFLYDGDALIAEYNGTTLLRRYLHGPGADVPLIWYEGGSKRYLHADHQGSIVAIAASNGFGWAANAYDEWGVPAAANQGRFQYTGQVWLAELGLYHYKARMYDPELGRFLQTDPVGYEDQINLYAYVGNDPVNLVDPSGESCIENQNGGFECKLDDPGDLTKEQIKAVEFSYTMAVNELMAIPETPVSLGVDLGDGVEMTVETTAGEIGRGLIAAEMIYGGDGEGPGDLRNASHLGDTITLYERGISRGDEALRATIVHEGGHTTPASDALRREFPSSMAKAYDHFGDGHQRSFKDALQQIRRERAREYNKRRRR